jgi:glutamate dehydrogenase
VKGQSASQRGRLIGLGAPEQIVDRIVRLFELDGAIGLATLGQKLGLDVVALTRAYTKLGEALGLDWAQQAANRFGARDQWERLLTANLARDFEQLRLEFLERQRATIRREPSTAGSRCKARASTSSAAPSIAPAPRP